MLPLAGMLFNVVAGLVVDKAQDLAEEHVEKMIDDILPDKAKKELDKIVKNDAGIIFLIYKKKKYNITCERKFEINKNKMIVGFSSKGCF